MTGHLESPSVRDRRERPADLLRETVDAIPSPDQSAMAAARERQDTLTKPPGSLGVLEDVSVRLAGLAGHCPPPLPEPAAVVIFAADHGVHAQGVTPWPQEVTAQMVTNFLSGGAVINAFAAQVAATVTVVDVGVNARLDPVTGLLARTVRRGSADMTLQPAMTRDEAFRAIEVGIETAHELVSAGNRCLAVGDMGIANTTASAALTAAFTGRDPAEVTGRGAGIDDHTHARKVDAVRRALALHRPDPADPIGTLAAVGGLDHAALTGCLIGAAALRTPVVLDGVTTGSAAVVAATLAPYALDAAIAGHRSIEPAHAVTLDHLGLRPLIDLDLRLGEGTGAALALPLVASAARTLREVASFHDAGVTGTASDIRR